MIKANELRIDNILIWKGKVCKVIGVSRLMFKVITLNGEHPDQDEYKEVMPIPLTPEWLERCGYKKDSMDGKWYKSPHNMPPIYNWRKGDYGMDGLPLITKSIQYVHQLQNLYFALTGEELNVKL